MAEFPALPLFTDAIIADCAHLSDAEFGLYLRILMLMWRSPDCRIPNDEAWIARKLQRDYAMALPLLNEFCQTDGNWLTQKRLLKEFAYVRKTSKRQSDAAKSRWNKEKPQSHGNAAWHTSGNALTPTPTPKVKEKDKSFSKSSQSSFDTFWKIYPRKIGKGNARTAFEKALKKAPLERILARAEAFARRCQYKDPQFIPHPATWLNQERWDDEPELLQRPSITPLGVGG